MPETTDSDSHKYRGEGLEDLSVFRMDELMPDEKAERAEKLYAMVIKKAVEDVLSEDKDLMLDAAYFLFAGKNKPVEESQLPESFESYSSAFGSDHKTVAGLIWKKLSYDKQKAIKQALKEAYGVDLPDYLILKPGPKMDKTPRK